MAFVFIFEQTQAELTHKYAEWNEPQEKPAWN